MSKDLYEVYKAVSQEGEVLYVGYGKRGRHTHCMSGISHNKELNRYYFMNSGKMFVEVIHENLSRDKAKQMEDYLIKSLQPKLNVVGVKKISNSFCAKRILIQTLLVLKTYVLAVITTKVILNQYQ